MTFKIVQEPIQPIWISQVKTAGLFFLNSMQVALKFVHRTSRYSALRATEVSDAVEIMSDTEQ